MSEPEDYEHLADDLDHEADRLQHEGERLGEHIADAREDWQHKRADESVPGAIPPDPDEPDALPDHTSGAPDVETDAD